MTEKIDIIFNYSNSDDVILKNMGAQIKQMRLNKNITQEQLQKMSGISRSAISDLENKGNATMRSFIQLLRALEKLDILNHFISEALISPVQIAKLKGKTRKRASGIDNTRTAKAVSEW